MFWIVLQQLAAFVTGAGILGFLIRALFTHFMSKDVESFKSQLKIAAAEHEVTFRRLDEEFHRHFVEVYRRLFRLYDRVASFIKDIEYEGEPAKSEKHKMVVQASTEFWDYLLDNRIYLPASLYKSTREFATELGVITRDYRVSLEHPQKFFEAGQDAVEKFNDETSQTFSAIVADIQKRLRVEVNV